MLNSLRKQQACFRICAALLLLLFGSTASASTIAQLDVGQLVRESALIFEGRVIATEVREDFETGRIHTYVTFEIHDVIKGDWSHTTIELRFLGGSVDGRSFSVQDMQIPELDEEGIYFIESLTRFQVNPLLGWSQGHMRIIKGPSGVRRVATNKGIPIVAMSAQSVSGNMRISRGFALGVEVGSAARPERALDVSSVKKILRSLRRGQQQ